MRNRARRVWLVLAVVASACGAGEPAPYVVSGPSGGSDAEGDGGSGTTPTGGSGGDRPGGGGGSQGDPSDGGSTVPSDASTTSDAGASPPSGSTWMGTGCGSFDAAQVYLEVEVGVSRETSGLVDLGASGAHCLEFKDAGAPRIRPTDGRLVYEETHAMGGHRLWLFTPDAMTWNDTDMTWEFPEDRQANDDLVDTTVCDPRGIWDPLIEPDTGRIVFRCAGTDTPRGWFAEGGEGVLGDGFELVALGPAGRKLALSTPDSSTPVVLDGAGTEIPVVGLDVAKALAIRARADGFRVALWAGPNPVDMALWQIANNGAASQVGSYSALPPDTQQSPAPDYVHYALDTSGNLYAFGRDTTTISTDTVIRRALAPDASQIVYDESDEDPPDLTTNPPSPGYRIRNADARRNWFVTGP